MTEQIKSALTAEEASHILRGYYPHLPPDPCALCKSIHDKLVRTRDGSGEQPFTREDVKELREVAQEFVRSWPVGVGILNNLADRIEALLPPAEKLG